MASLLLRISNFVKVAVCFLLRLFGELQLIDLRAILSLSLRLANAWGGIAACFSSYLKLCESGCLFSLTAIR